MNATINECSSEIADDSSLLQQSIAASTQASGNADISVHTLCEPNSEKVNDPEFLCDGCLTEGENVQATSFCIACTEYLCQQCSKDHRRNKLTRGHKILTDGDLPTNIQYFKLLNENMLCPLHKQTSITLRCVDDDAYICVECIMATHKKCSNFETITTDVNAAEVYVTKTMSKLTDLGEKVNSVLIQTETRIENIIKEQSNIEEEQSKFICYLYETIAKLGEVLKQEIKVKSETEIVSLKRDVELCRNILESVNDSKSLLEIVQHHGDTTQSKVINRVVEKKCKNFEDAIETQVNKQNFHFNFIPSQRLLKLKNLGEVKVVHDEPLNLHDVSNKSSPSTSSKQQSDHHVLPSLKNSFSDCPKQQKDQPAALIVEKLKLVEKSINAKSIGESAIQAHGVVKNNNWIHRDVSDAGTNYNIRLGNDEVTCNIIACGKLSEGRIVLLDSGNCKIKVFARDFTTCWWLKLNDYPNDMCLFEGDLIVVSFVNLKTIDRFVVKEDEIKSSGGFNTKLFNRSITKYTENRLLILSSQRKCNDYVLNGKDVIEISLRDVLSGKHLTTFTKIYDDRMAALNLTDAIRVSMTKNNEVLIADKKTVICLIQDKGKLSLTQKWVFRRGEQYLKDIVDVGTDVHGNIYVCGTLSNNIHQISANDHRNYRVLLSNIAAPSSVLVDGENIIVACYYDNIISIYKFI